MFGVLIVTGGRLADLFGRKRIFMIGAGIFAVFSLAAGLMPSVVPLIACRGLMGIGGAMMWPAILGMTYALLPEEKAGLAGGLILGVAGLGNAVGPMFGGLLTDELSWRWVFFINLPIDRVRDVRDPPRGEREHVDATERPHRLRRGRGPVGRGRLDPARARRRARRRLRRPDDPRALRRWAR